MFVFLLKKINFFVIIIFRLARIENSCILCLSWEFFFLNIKIPKAAAPAEQPMNWAAEIYTLIRKLFSIQLQRLDDR